MRVRKMNWFVKFITFNWPIAITLAPFGIYIKEKYWDDDLVYVHENIHWVQQMEMLIIFFYLWYFIEWVIRLFIHGRKAYLNISFEREAETNEDSIDYFIRRKRFAWFKYLTK